MADEDSSILDDPSTSNEIEALVKKRDVENLAHKTQAWKEHRAELRASAVKQGYQYVILLIDELLEDAERLRLETE